MSRVSIIIPVYNVEKYLEECLRSIIAEMRACDEVILINDGSKDNSLEICKRYESENVKVISNENHGVSYSRNCGIENSSGDYIAFVDSDDYLLPGWRESFEKATETGSDVVYFSKSGVEDASRSDIARNILCVSGGKKLDIKGSACWSKLFKAELVKDNGITFNSEVINGEDGIFSLQCFLKAKTYSIVKAEPFYFYRINNTSATHSFNPRYNSSNIKYIEVVTEELKSSDVFSAEQIKYIMDYITYNGIYILACRISYVDKMKERALFYDSFKSPLYLEFYKTYEPLWQHQKFKTKIFDLILKEEYDKAMRKIRLRRFIFDLAKKVLRKKNGF